MFGWEYDHAESEEVSRREVPDEVRRPVAGVTTTYGTPDAILPQHIGVEVGSDP
jgi:hypothetical protein